MEENSDKRYQELTEYLMAAYELIRVVLSQLPIPIELPPVNAEWEPLTAIQAAQRTRDELIPAQPIDALDKSLLERSLLDWLTVYDLGGLVKMAGPAPWRLDAMDYGINRIVTFLDQAAESLGIDTNPPESE